MLVRKCNACGKIYDDPWRNGPRESVGELRIITPNTDWDALTTTDVCEIDFCHECVEKVKELIDVIKDTSETGETYCIHIYSKEEETK